MWETPKSGAHMIISFLQMHQNLKPGAAVITNAEHIAKVNGGVGMDGVIPTSILVVHVSACAGEVQTRCNVRF